MLSVTSKPFMMSAFMLYVFMQSVAAPTLRQNKLECFLWMYFLANLIFQGTAWACPREASYGDQFYGPNCLLQT